MVPHPRIAYERFQHLEVGRQAKLATLDNALSAYIGIDLERPDALALMANIVARVQRCKAFFEGHGAPGALIDKLQPAFRVLDKVASPELREQLQRQAPSPR